MTYKDFIWVGILIIVTGFIVIPSTRSIFESLTQSYPYIMGFTKTALLASLGERLVVRIKTGSYFGDQGFLLKALVWGFLGMGFVLIFKLFAEGVTATQAAGLLPVISNPPWASMLLTAFLISLLMNVVFAPTFMLLHRITDGYIHLGEGQLKGISKIKLSEVIAHINFTYFFSFVLFKTIPLFWIPAHTITFLLPENYRVLMAAYLSIALGLLLTLAQPKIQK
ncbi:MAG: hypothetical protein ACNA7K_01255 [Acholeplasmataceae bacterium]